MRKSRISCSEILELFHAQCVEVARTSDGAQSRHPVPLVRHPASLPAGHRASPEGRCGRRRALLPRDTPKGRRRVSPALRFALRPASAARTAGCRRCGSSPPRPACRCARRRRTRPSPCRRAENSLGAAVTCTVFGVMPSFSCSRPAIETISVPSRPSEAQLSPAGNCSGTTPMPMRFERWMRSKLSVMTALTPSRLVPLAAQSRDEPEPYSLPPKITSGVPGLLIVLTRVVDERLRSALLREVAGVAALHLVAVVDGAHELVLQADVRERAADHDLVVAAARAVGVEVLALDAVLGQVLPGRAVDLDVAGRADVVGRDRVAAASP